MRLFGTASLALIGTVLVLPLAIIGAGFVQWTWPEAFGIEDGSGVGFVIVILPLAIPFSVGGFFLLRWAGRRMSRWVWLGPAIPLLLLALRALIDTASRLGTDRRHVQTENQAATLSGRSAGARGRDLSAISKDQRAGLYVHYQFSPTDRVVIGCGCEVQPGSLSRSGYMVLMRSVRRAPATEQNHPRIVQPDGFAADA